MYPPTGPFVIQSLLSIRWYAVCILGGALIAAWFGARRAAMAGRNPEHAWNLLAVGLVAAIITARIWYVIFECPTRFAPLWQTFSADPATNWRDLIAIINPATGGIAIQGALVGALLAGYVYTRRHQLAFAEWADYAAPCIPIGQVFGRWGNFWNQEAYGRPTTLPWGLHLTAQGCPPEAPHCHRIGPYTDLARFPEATRFHPTFLYESLWNVGVIVSLLVLERRAKAWLRRGDLMLLYGMLYSAGRFWVEGLRVDSLCTGGVGGECSGQWRTAQVVSVLTLLGCAAILAYRHRRSTPPATAATI